MTAELEVVDHAHEVKKGKIKALSDFSYVLDGEQLKDGMILANLELRQLLL